MKKLFLALLAFAAAVGTADAADVRVKKPLHRASPVASYDWTGFYIGGHAGWAWTNTNWSDAARSLGLVSYTANRGFYGVQGGYNWQSGNTVLGIEAQSSWGEIRKGADWIDPDTQPRGIFRRTGTTVENLGTIAGRLGHAWDRSLVFVKGGAAWAHDVYRLINVANGAPLADASDTRWGWMVGVGYEYAFLGNWSAKIEYNYLAFDNHRVTLVGPLLTRAFDVNEDISLVKVGINYRFGPVATPVVAKY